MSKKKQIFIRLVTLGDQLCFSVANFLLSIILARFYSEVELAAYVIGLSIALTIQGVQRNCYVVQNAVLAPEILRRRTSKVLGEQSIVWLFLVSVEVLIGALLFAFSDNEYYHFVAVATIISTLIYTQLEFDRIIFVKHDRFMHAAAMSVGFLLFIGLFFFLVPAYGVSFYAFMGAIAVYMVMKMLWLFVTTVWPDFFWGMRLLRRDFKKYFKSAVMGVLGYSGHNHVPVFVLGWFAVPIHAAVFGAMRGLMQPLQIVIRSLDIIDKNYFQARVKSSGGMRSVLIRQMAIYGGVSMCVVIGALLFGELVIHIAYGEKYAGYSYILTGWAVIFTMLAITLPLETVIVKLDKLNVYNNLRIISGVVGVILSFALWREYGAMGGVIACLGGWVCTIIFALYLVKDVFRGEP